MRVSYSGLETFKRCPLKFKLQYLDKIRTAKSFWNIDSQNFKNAP